jgi:hypothetical protein
MRPIRAATTVAGTVRTANTAMDLGPTTLSAATTLNSRGGNIVLDSVAGGTQDLTLHGDIGVWNGHA